MKRTGSTGTGDGSSESQGLNAQNVSSFEIALKELEGIVGELEKGELPLESQLKSFEKGVSLSRDCIRRLEEVERRVEILVQSSESGMTTTPFQPENNSPASQ